MKVIIYRMKLVLIATLILFGSILSLGAEEILMDATEIEKYTKDRKKTPPDNLRILFKIATTAPRGSLGYNYINSKIIKGIDKISNGLFRIQFIGSDLEGSNNVIQNIETLQVNGVYITGMAISKMVPELSVLGLPFLFEYEPDLFWNGKYTEIDYVLEKMEPAFAKFAAKNGYQFGGYSEVSLCFIGSDAPIKEADNVKNLRYWVWIGDDMRHRAAKAMEFNSITSLGIFQTADAFDDGLINSVPLGHSNAILYKWPPYIKYLTGYPIAGYDCAVALFDQKKMDNIVDFIKKWGRKYDIKNPRRFRRNLLRFMDISLSRKMRFLIRREEAKIRQHLVQKKNINIIEMPEEELSKLREKVEPLYKKLADEMYPKKLLEDLLRYRDRYRKLKESGKLTDKWRGKGIMPGADQQDGWRF